MQVGLHIHPLGSPKSVKNKIDWSEAGGNKQAVLEDRENRWLSGGMKEPKAQGTTRRATLCINLNPIVVLRLHMSDYWRLRASFCGRAGLDWTGLANLFACAQT
jgi:hypothetical protein